MRTDSINLYSMGSERIEMDAIDIFEIGAVVIGLIGLIDYGICKLRKYGENPPKLLSIFKRGK